MTQTCKERHSTFQSLSEDEMESHESTKVLVPQAYSGPQPQAEHEKVCIVMPVRSEEMDQTEKEAS